MAGLLVLGTDTGCGKTVVGMLLLAHARSLSVPVAALKPVETGCDPDPADALRLSAASGSGDPVDLVCPYRLALPAAPEAAAAAQGLFVDPTRIRGCFETLSAGGRFVLVEAAGTAGTPYGPGMLALDIAGLLDVPVVLVARAVLGTVGQSLVALRAIREAGARCAGVILNRVPGTRPGPEDPTNAPLIEAHSDGVPVLGTLPLIGDPVPGHRDPAAVRAWSDRHAGVLAGSVDLSRIPGLGALLMGG